MVRPPHPRSVAGFPIGPAGLPASTAESPGSANTATGPGLSDDTPGADDADDADDHRIARIYADRLRRFGIHHKALHWSTRRGQLERFARLAAAGLQSGHSLLDVGCGLGDFWAWLQDQGLAVDYTGIDMTPEMVAACRRRHGTGRFLRANLFDSALGFAPQSFDWVMASGLFAHRTVEPEAYMRQGIARMMTLARRGVAFNAQSTRAPNPAAWRLYHADPDRTLAWCQATGWSCLMTHDALETDFTLCLWRQGAG